MNEKDIIETNKALIDEFPFLMPRNRWTGEVPEDYDYSYTELDAMPSGWRIAFGLDLCEELKEELVRANLLHEYRITQIKEKYGALCWYDFGNTEKGFEIIHKYEDMSQHICIHCGKPATKISMGWISPWCDDCIDDSIKCMPIDEYFEEITEDE